MAPVVAETKIGRQRNPSVISEVLPDEDETLPTNWRPFQSSRVVEAGYSPSAQRLYVRFVKPRPEGTPWVYESVPPNVWRNMKRQASVGRFVNRVLNNYDYHRGDF
jgi:hypothetical protein